VITARRFTSTKILDFCTKPFIASMPMKIVKGGKGPSSDVLLRDGWMDLGALAQRDEDLAMTELIAGELRNC